MASKLNNARNSTVIKNLPKLIKNTHAVTMQAVYHGHPDSRIKPNPTFYDKLLCESKSPLPVSHNQLHMGGKWENVKFSFPPILIQPLPFPFPFP